jgi:hypothetical protein
MVELTEHRRSKLTNYATKFGVAIDLIDIHAIWDSTLSEDENMRIIKEEIDKLAPMTTDANIEKIAKNAEEQELKVIKFEMERIKEVRIHAFDAIKNSNCPELNKYYNSLRKIVKTIVNAEKVHSMILIGAPGLGKSFQVTQELLHLGAEFEIIQGNITPVQLYNKLYAYREKTMVFDDTLPMLKNKHILSLLYAAMWTAEGKDRKIEWQSTSSKVERESFLFSGKIIFILNEVSRDGMEIRTLMSRCLTYELNFDYRERMEIIYTLAKLIAKSPEEAAENLRLAEWLEQNTNEATEDLSLRSFFKIKELARVNPGEWQKLALEVEGLKPVPELKIIKELYESGKSVKEQIQEWRDRTNRERGAYYSWRIRYLEMRGKVA